MSSQLQDLRNVESSAPTLDSRGRFGLPGFAAERRQSALSAYGIDVLPGSSDRAGDARSVTVLIPALNEENAVGSVIDRVPVRALRRSGYGVRVWVVDGRSTDATPEIARNRGAEVFVQSGAGKGTGVRQALDYLLDRRPPGSEDRFFVMLDADGTYPPEQIRRVVDALAGGADVVLGSRFRGHAEDGAITNLNRIGNRLLSRLASFLFRHPVSDVCTGMWGFRESSLNRFGLRANGFDLEADLFASACEAGVRVMEVPVDYHRRIGEAKLIPLRAGVLIAFRLVMRKLNPREGLRSGRRPWTGRPAGGPL